MKMRTVIIIIAVVLLAVFLFPVASLYSDGGTNSYGSIIGIYEVLDYNEINVSGNLLWLKRGVEVKIFGIKVYDNTYFTDMDGNRVELPVADTD